MKIPDSRGMIPGARPSASLLLAPALALLLACGSHGDAQGTRSAPAGGAVATADPGLTAAIPPDDIWNKDPCRYLSVAEAEAHIGPLLHAPYRGKDDGITADAAGTKCVYRAKNGRHLTVAFQWMEGKQDFKQYTGGFLSQFMPADKGKTDTLSDAWDQAAIRIGDLIAIKGDTELTLYYGDMTDGLLGASAAAEAIIHRYGAPLAYNGAAAATNVPGPLVAPRDPCSLLTRAEVESQLGPLSADPRTDGSECHYATRNGDVILWIAWTGGFRGLFEGRAVRANGTALAGQMGLNEDDQFAKMKAGLAQRGIDKGRIPSATDSSLSGPWTDSRVDGMDGSLTVVKKDVGMTLPYIAGNPPAAVALLTIAMNRI